MQSSYGIRMIENNYYAMPVFVKAGYNQKMTLQIIRFTDTKKYLKNYNNIYKPN